MSKLKYSPEVQERIVQALRIGAFIPTAAKYAGVSGGTLWRWMAEGKADEKSPYRELYEAVEKARAGCETHLLGLVYKAAQDGTWTAAAWLLERRHARRWAKKDLADAKKLILAATQSLYPDDPAEQMKVIRTLEAAAQKKLNGKAA